MVCLESTAKKINISHYNFLMQGSVLSNGKIDVKIIFYIKRLRRNFPLNKILVSCWSADDITQNALLKLARYYDFDIIFSNDPGTISANFKGVKYNCNLNRLIVSTKNGLKYLSGDYVIKLRTDSYFYNDKLITYLSDYFNNISPSLKRNEEYKVFEDRVLNCNLFARNPRSYLPYLFHPGDILLIGLRNDLIKLFDIELADSDIFESFTQSYFFTMMKLVPEQYIWVNCIKKVKGIDIYSRNELISEDKIIESERYYVNNFFVFSPFSVGFSWPKHAEQYQSKGKYSIYDERDWMSLYKIHILGVNIEEIPVDRCKSTIVFFMKMYFYVRTNLMKFPFLKRMAIKIFNKRN